MGGPTQIQRARTQCPSNIQKDFIRVNDGSRPMVLKPKCYARIMGLPDQESKRRTIPTAKDIGCFLSVNATVIRTGAVKMVEKYKTFLCSTCKQCFKVKADFEQYSKVPMPTQCQARTHAGLPPCRGFRFQVQPTDPGSMPEMCQDYQEIKIQEQTNKLSPGTIPRSMVVILTDDLVDYAKSGDDVTITGTVIQRWNPTVVGERCDIEIVLLANYVHINNEQRSGEAVTERRNKILASVCPQVYGLYLVKLAVMLVLSGGVQKVDESGLRVRGEPHLLLVGDPGTGKSQFLKFAAELSARSVLTTGIGSSSAGLTVAAVRDGPEWQLEAGALVLADRGLCCIDEFGGMSQHDKTAIHEAMEQQSISIAKAGIVCKLNTRCSVIAATNPKGRYDPEQPVSINIALASPLLSRFDLVFVLMDTGNIEWDRKIASFILQTQRRQDGESVRKMKNRRRDRRMQRREGGEALDGRGGDGGSRKDDDEEEEESWSLDDMKAYLAWIKSSFEPRLTQPAEQVLMAYYQLQRRADLRNAARTTIRLLESLIRLAQAHAKLLAKNLVTLEDAIAVVSLMETTAQGGAAMIGAVNPLHASFPADAEEEYSRQERLMLSRLGLTELKRQAPPRADPPGHDSEDDRPARQSSKKRTRDDDLFSSPDAGVNSRIKQEPSSPVTSRFFDPNDSIESVASTLPHVAPEPRTNGESHTRSERSGQIGSLDSQDYDDGCEMTPEGGPSIEY
ncbi:DNA helicase mcm9 [Actinomortierella ambigua]|nr:DNA helicase mcm9 [Actinomortierella ambigua]